MWNERYSTQEFIFGKEPSQFVKKYAASLWPKSKILLPADGEGRNSCYLASLGHDVYASDYSQIGQEKAKKLAQELNVNVNFSIFDVENEEWENEIYDAIFAVFIQFSPPDARAKVFKGIKKSLKKGGTLYLHGYTPKQLEYGTGGPKQVENLYTQELLRNEFADFEIKILESYETVLDEGAGHKGISALIDLVAIKL